jgi:hypothetical protein
MKKIVFSAGLMLLTGLGGVFANEGPSLVNKKVLESFNDRFTGAQDVSWKEEGDLEIASFQFDGLFFFAYFGKEGDWVATARNILSSQLPIPLLMQLKKGYPDFWISALVEVDSQSGINYFIRLENVNKILLLRSSGYDGWTTMTKTKKE